MCSVSVLILFDDFFYDWLSEHRCILAGVLGTVGYHPSIKIKVLFSLKVDT